jgi:hypothetical protein
MSSLLLLACGGGAVESEDYGEEILPTESQLAINFPASGATDRSADVGGYAPWYVATRTVTESVNGVIRFVLGSVSWVVTTQRPTWVDDEHTRAMWGPYQDSGLDPVSTGIWVERQADGGFHWAVFQVPNGGTLEDDAVAIVAGEVDAGSTRSEASGTFAVDFDAAADLDPAVGTVGGFGVEYAYDAEGVAALVGMQSYGQRNGELHDAAYSYEEDYTGAGTMDLAWLEDVNGGGTDEVITLRSRWQADGQGRGDAEVLGGDLAVDVTANNCWGADFETVYWTDTIGMYDEEGAESSCAFTPAEYASEATFTLTEGS